MGHRGMFVLQPRRISEIVVTGLALVTLGLPSVATAATPDRSPAQNAGATGGSPWPDPVPTAVRLSPTHGSAPPVTVTPVSTAPARTAPSAPTRSAPHPTEQASSPRVAVVTSSAVEHAQSTRRAVVPARKHRSPGARPPHRTAGPVSVNLPLARVAVPNLVGSSREPQPSGVLLLLSSLSLGLLVVASLTLLRRVKRLNGGWWA